MKSKHLKRTSIMHGGATLLILMALLLAMALLMVMAHRATMFEQLSSTHQQRSQHAFEAAQAGLEWALAQLNQPQPLNAQCQPTSAPGWGRFRDRPALAGTLTAHCTQNAAQDWACQCPNPGQAITPLSSTATPPLSFGITLTPDSPPRGLKISSTGCVGGQVCQAPGNSPLPEAALQTHISVGYMPSLGLQPKAALTIRGKADLTQSVLKTDFSATQTTPNLALLSGDSVQANTPPEPRQTHDAPLQQLSDEAFFTHLFRMDKVAFQSLPTVLKIPCQNGCDTELKNAVNSSQTMLWLEGGLHIKQNLTLGSEHNPVLLVVNGPIRLESALTLYGLIYSTSPHWHDSSVLGSTLHGAVVIEGNFIAQGPIHLHHNTALLRLLHQQQGTYVKVAGSWRDF